MKPRHLLGFSCFLVFRDVVISRFTVPHVKLLPVCARRGLFSAEGIQPVQSENRKMNEQDSAAKMAALHTGGSRCCATAAKMAAPHNGEVINRHLRRVKRKRKGKEAFPP